MSSSTKTSSLKNEKRNMKETTTTTTKEEALKDPDGSLNLIRGMSDQEARKRRLELITKLRSNTQNKKKKKLKGGYEYRNEIIPSSTYTSMQHIPTKDKVLKAKLERKSTKLLESNMATIDAKTILQTGSPGMIEIENDMESTTKVTQQQLKRTLPKEDARHIYDISLPETAPYGFKYDRSGRYGILYGCKSNSNGHIAIMDNHTLSLSTEFYLQNDMVRDVCFLHNTTLFATAQKNHVYIYDDTGTEIHHLKDHIDPLALDYLPYHFLLVSINRKGWLNYHDTSTGQLISKHRTKLGPCHAIKQNPMNAIMHCGHTNGTVTLWSPASKDYLVKVLCHKGASVTGIAIANHASNSSDVMVTSGTDCKVRIWDLRNTYQELHSYYVPRGSGVPTSIDVSQMGILGVGHGSHCTFWAPEALKTKVKKPYMYHLIPASNPIQTLRFRPHEDICGIGHNKGFSSIIIPGSGEPNIDTLEYNNHSNPYQNDKRQQNEAEVKALLDKLDPNTITLQPNAIGTLEDVNAYGNDDDEDDKKDVIDNIISRKKKKKRGQSKVQTDLRRKEKTFTEQSKLKLREKRNNEAVDSEDEDNDDEIPQKTEVLKEQAPSALKRFFK